MSSASSSSSSRRRSPRLGKRSVPSSAQSGSGWSPESLDQAEEDGYHPSEQEPLPIAKVVLKKMSKEEIAQVTGGERRVRGDTFNQRNTGEIASVLLDVSVIELDQEDHDDQEDQEGNDLGDGPPILTDSDVSSEGPLPDLPGTSQYQELEDIITIDDEEDRDPSAEDEIMILGDEAAAQILDHSESLNDRFSAVVRSLDEATGNTWHTPSVNRNDTTIDLTKSDSPLTVRLKAAGSSSNGGSKVPQDAPSREPLTCPVCLESYVVLSKGNVKLMHLKCGHVCCGPCLQETLKRRPVCPICRADVRRGEPRQLFI